MKLAGTSLDAAQRSLKLLKDKEPHCLLSSQLRAPHAGRVQKELERWKQKAEICNVSWQRGFTGEV